MAQTPPTAHHKCPVCSSPYSRQNPRTRDHIFPRVWGGASGFYLTIRNIRPACQRCNSLLAACGHCIGAAACVLDVARIDCVAPRDVFRRWRMCTAAQNRTMGRRTIRRIVRGRISSVNTHG